jgi:hypothetical protein
MTREEGNLVGEAVAVGDLVILTQDMRQVYRVNTNDRFDLVAGERFAVTRVNNASLNVRSIETKEVVETRNYNRRRVERHVSFSIDRAFLMYEDPNYVPPPPPRKLGTKPESTEDMEYLDINDPRIQWLFDDMGVYADQQGYCSQYDTLCVRLGIPGRPRDFNVNRTVNGIEIRAVIKARSQREANEMFAAAMSTPAPVIEKVGPSE